MVEGQWVTLFVHQSRLACKGISEPRPELRAAGVSRPESLHHAHLPTGLALFLAAQSAKLIERDRGLAGGLLGGGGAQAADRHRSDTEQRNAPMHPRRGACVAVVASVDHSLLESVGIAASIGTQTLGIRCHVVEVGQLGLVDILATHYHLAGRELAVLRDIEVHAEQARVTGLQGREPTTLGTSGTLPEEARVERGQPFDRGEVDPMNGDRIRSTSPGLEAGGGA